VFLTLGAWEADGITFEIASRRNLDSRVVVPFFRHDDGELYAGLLHRDRVSRTLRGARVAARLRIEIDISDP
jgi:hypothetical protein